MGRDALSRIGSLLRGLDGWEGDWLLTPLWARVVTLAVLPAVMSAAVFVALLQTYSEDY